MTKRGERILVYAAAALCAIFQTACGSEDPKGAGASGELDFKAFDDAVTAMLKDKGLPGATAVVVHRDLGIVHKSAYGSFKLDRTSLIASSGKILAVGILMRLQEQGMLDIDGPVGAYLGDEANPKYALTLAQMLSNSSGLPNSTTYGPYICMGLPTGTLTDCAKAIYQTVDDAADIIPPDTEYKYGGGQWQLAGGVAEVVSGKSWAALVEDTYGTTCGIQSFGYVNYFLQQLQVEGALMGYPSFVNGDVADVQPTDNPNIEGGAYAKVEDYAKVLLMHLRGGLCEETRALSEESVERMQEDRIATYGGVTTRPERAGYGLGWWIDRDVTGQYEDRGGYGSLPWIDTERGYGAIIIVESVNTDGSDLRAATQPILEKIFTVGRKF